MADLPWDGAAKLLSAGPLGLGAVIILVTGTILLSRQSLLREKFRLALSMLVAGVVLTLAGFFILHEQITTTATQAAKALDAATAQDNQDKQALATAVGSLSDKESQLNDAIISKNNLEEKLSTATNALDAANTQDKQDKQDLLTATSHLDERTAQLNGAIAATTNLRSSLATATAALNAIKGPIEDASTALGGNMLDINTAQCGGGPHGTDCAHEPEVRSRIVQATSDLTAADAKLTSALAAIH